MRDRDRNDNPDVMTTRDVSTRVLIGRRTGDQVTVLGAGIAMAPQVVLVPLSMSGLLRPRIGLVVLPDAHAHAFEAVPVLQVLRSEPGTGDVLGLVLEQPLAAHEDPPEEEVDTWLRQRLSGEAHGGGEGATRHTRGSAPSGEGRFQPMRKKRSNNPTCVLFPRLCR